MPRVKIRHQLTPSDHPYFNPPPILPMVTAIYVFLDIQNANGARSNVTGVIRFVSEKFSRADR